jgi:hypothetical protein
VVNGAVALRFTAADNVLPVDYLEAANEVGNWLLETAHHRSRGWTWPVRPTVSQIGDVGLYGGMAGPTLFFVEAYRTTGELKWLDGARQGTQWMGHVRTRGVTTTTTSIFD